MIRCYLWKLVQIKVGSFFGEEIREQVTNMK